MKYIILILLLPFMSCTKSVPEKEEGNVQYNIIQPQESIYKITDEKVSPEDIYGKYFEKRYFMNNNLIKIERYNKKGILTDELNVPAISVFEYDQNNKLKFIKYFDKNGKKAVDQKLKYWSKEIIHSNLSTVIEFYSDTSGNLLKLPVNPEEMENHIAPVLVYINTPKGTLIKAFDDEFNLLSEAYGEKPCIPFIDCGGVK